MAFTHGKNARLWVDQYELTAFFNNFTMAAKAGTAETTVFGKGAKTYIGGLQEGTISGKGYFDGVNPEDSEMTNALGRQQNMSVTFSPSGAVTVGSRVVVAYAAETDYSIDVPVTGVVATTFSAMADSGLSTGVALFSPDTAIVTATTTNGTGSNDAGLSPLAATTIAVGSNGATLPQATINVASTTGFAAATTSNPQVAVVTTSTGPQVVTYTGSTGSTFTGCTGGGGSMATGGAVSQADTTNSGFVANLHVVTLTGTGSPTVTAKIQHSDDNTNWADLTSFNGGATITAPGAYSAFAAYGVVINRYLRAVLVTAGTTISTTCLVAAARQ